MANEPDRRLELQGVLQEILGGPDVYFQPPPTLRMNYPCIVYGRDNAWVQFADNKPYSRTKRYKITVIDSDPDSDIPEKVAKLPLCTFSRHYTADHLNHDVFNLYF